MTEQDITTTAKWLTKPEIEKLLRMAYFSFDAKLREYAESLKEIHVTQGK